MTTRTRSRRTNGFTLIELLMVVAIIAMVVSGATIGLGALTRTRLRSSAMKVVSAANFAYARSLTHGTTTRLLFDFENNTMAVEETKTQVTLASDAEIDEGVTGAVDPWEMARQRVERPLDAVKASSAFGPITNDDGEALKQYSAQPLGSGVMLYRLITAHEPDPRIDGEGAIYFFPGGTTEQAVVQLTDDSESVYSIEIHPLTGRGRIYPYAYEPIDQLDDGSEVRDSR